MKGAGFDEGYGKVNRGNLAFRDVELALVEFGTEEEALAVDAGDGGVIPSRNGFADLGFPFFDVFDEVL